MELQLERHLRGRYEILATLGEGGMGVVYKARDARLGRLVALKVLASAMMDCAEARDRALGEARAIAALNHPNIATIHEIIESDGGPVLVLEYLPGGTLRSRTGARPLPLTEIVTFGLEIADGLAHAHSRGVIHGDVKTENVMFAEDGRLKLTDFGLARRHDERTAAVDARIIGTLMYMAPECLHGRPADCLTDIFSLGVVLEEMARPQAMPEPFQNLVARATARDRSQRFQTVQELADALRPFDVAQGKRIATTKPTPCETPTILVIEDDDGLRSTLETGLSSEGYRVLQAGNGREGIRLAVEEAPHLVLLDVTLPGLNGFDVCRELRHKGFKAPIIMVTGRVEEVDRVVGLEIGADDYLTKPFGRRELLARIRVHLRRTAARSA